MYADKRTAFHQKVGFQAVRKQVLDGSSQQVTILNYNRRNWPTKILSLFNKKKEKKRKKKKERRKRKKSTFEIEQVSRRPYTDERVGMRGGKTRTGIIR